MDSGRVRLERCCATMRTVVMSASWCVFLGGVEVLICFWNCARSRTCTSSLGVSNVCSCVDFLCFLSLSFSKTLSSCSPSTRENSAVQFAFWPCSGPMPVASRMAVTLLWSGRVRHYRAQFPIEFPKQRTQTTSWWSGWFVVEWNQFSLRIWHFFPAVAFKCFPVTPA